MSSGEPPAPRAVAPEAPNSPPSATSPLDQAIAAYLQELVDAGYRPKTVQWHQTALSQLRAYLHTHQQSQGLDVLTEMVVQGWLTALRTTPTATGALRSGTTISTYARSVRAFGNWLVSTGRQSHSLFSSRPKPVQLAEPEAFMQLLKVCELATDTGASAEKVTARNRALLWLMWDGWQSQAGSSGTRMPRSRWLKGLQEEARSYLIRPESCLDVGVVARCFEVKDTKSCAQGAVLLVDTLPRVRPVRLLIALYAVIASLLNGLASQKCSW